MTPNSQNVWFGVAMFLMGLIAGVVLSVAGGGMKLGGGGSSGGSSGGTPPPAQQQADVNDRMIAYAEDLGISEDDFTSCMKDNNFSDLINADLKGGTAAGITGTPGNVLVSLKTGKARLISGARPLSSFQAEIDDMLKNPSGLSKDSSVREVTNLPKIDFSKDHYRGSTEAQIALVEYSDYQCPFCHRVHPTIKQVAEQYGDKVVWVYRHFPLVSIHPEAMPLATGAECVNKLKGSDAFWQYTDTVMSE